MITAHTEREASSAARVAAAHGMVLTCVGIVTLCLASTASVAQEGRPPASAPTVASAEPGAVKQDHQGDDNAEASLPGLLTDAQKLAASLTPPVFLKPPPGKLPKLPGTAAADPADLSSDPRNFRGTWGRYKPSGNTLIRIQTDMYGEPLPFTMQGAKVLQRRVVSLTAGKPFSNASATCRPPGVLWQMDIGMPFHVVQTKAYIELMFNEYHGRWYIQLDPAFSPAPTTPQYMGYSLGHWDGNTLVVETSGMKAADWLDFDGTPLSRDAKLVIRMRKIEDGDGKTYIEMLTTISDPIYYTGPWSIVRRFRPNGSAVSEYNCEEQVGDPSVDAAGLLIEPTTM